MAISRTANGLAYVSDGTLTGWTGDATWTSEAGPTLLAFDPSPIPAQVPALTGADAGGNRESWTFIDDDGAWYEFYGAGNGSATDQNGPWVPQVAKSTNRGLSWTKLGPLNMGRTVGGSASLYPSADLLFVEKRSGTYYLHRLTAGGVIANQICGNPYSSDVWSASVITGPYTYVGGTVSPSTGTTFDDRDAYAGCMVKDGGGTYHLFYSTCNQTGDPGNVGGATWQVGRSTGSSPSGPFTKTGSAVLPAAIAGQPENPEVFFHTGLGLWVMLINQVNRTAGLTDKNRVFFSTSLTDWSAATYHDFQRVCQLDGPNAVGLSRVFHKSEGAVVFDTTSNALGSMPITYDGYPTNATGSSYNHIDRRILFAAIEPSAYALMFTPPAIVPPVFSDNFSSETAGNLGGQNGWTDASGANPKPQVTSSHTLDMLSAAAPGIVIQTGVGSVINAQQDMQATFGTTCGVGPIFCYSNLTSPFYHCDFSDTQATVAYWNGSTDSTLATYSHTSTTNANNKYTAILNGGTFTLQVNGVTVGSYTPSNNPSLIASGGLLGLRSAFPGTGSRVVTNYAYSVPATGSVAKPIYRSVAHGDFTAEFAVMFDDATAGGYLDFFYRLQAAGNLNNGYRMRVAGTSAGSATVVGAGGMSGASTILAGTDYPFSNWAYGCGSTQPTISKVWHRVRIKVRKNRHQVWFDGEKQLDFTDANFTSGAGIALVASSNKCHVRQLSMRADDIVTITGLTAGQTVTLRGPGGIPIDTKTAQAASVALTHTHYPQTSIDIDGVDVITPPGGIWGGDVYAYPAAGQSYTFS